MSLSFKEKELVNLGASVAAGCKACTDYHFRKAQEAHASDEAIEQTISDALSVRNNAKDIMESHGLALIGIAKGPNDHYSTKGTTRIKELVSIAASFSVNCTSNLEKHISAARKIGISDDEVMSALDAALFVKGKAASYVERIGKLRKRNVELQRLLKKLQETQRQLVQSEKMAAIGRLTAGIAHEINNPVGALKSTMDVLTRCVAKMKRSSEPDKTQVEVKNSRDFQKLFKILEDNSRLALSASDRITEIVNSLRNFARLDEAEFQRVDIHEGIESTLTLIHHIIREEIKLVKEYGDIPRIHCYPGDLNQIFMTLLTNAIQAMETEGTITIKTFSGDQQVYVKISDTGKGIPSEKLKSLFDVSFVTKKSRISMGMGLSNAYHVIQKHNGEIKVESEVGKGTAFTIALPVNQNNLQGSSVH